MSKVVDLVSINKYIASFQSNDEIPRMIFGIFKKKKV